MYVSQTVQVVDTGLVARRDTAAVQPRLGLNSATQFARMPSQHDTGYAVVLADAAVILADIWIRIFEQNCFSLYLPKEFVRNRARVSGVVVRRGYSLDLTVGVE